MFSETNQEKRWQEVYVSGNILEAKLSIHDKYSSVFIDTTGEIIEALSLRGNEKLLDIGCGTGRFFQELRQRGHRGFLVGVDISVGGFRQEDKKRQTFLIQASGLNLPVASHSFNLVTSLHTLSHIQEMGLLMNEIKRVLASGGLFLATANSLLNYPHVKEFRNRVFKNRGWGKPSFTTNVFNVENADNILGQYWREVNTRVVEGELKIPVDEFVKYFAANIPVWDYQPGEIEKEEILADVNVWAREVAKDGFIVEPKWMSFSTCTD